MITHPRPWSRTRPSLFGLAVCATLLVAPAALGQDPSAEGPMTGGPNAGGGLSSEEITAKAEAALSDGDTQETAANGSDAKPAAGLNYLDLVVRGGWLMLPIIAMSFLVVAFGVERALGLRRSRIFPSRFREGLETFIRQGDRADPNRLVELCREYPSSAATVVRAGLLRLGKPIADLEHATAGAESREADRLYANVRWLSLAASVTPLLGLLGTVWGMIHAFFNTANLPTGANRAEYLADGIYVALVTTFAGLAVAIPAAVLAHFFESRILSTFRHLNETLFRLLPRLEQYEGRVRRESSPKSTGGGA